MTLAPPSQQPTVNPRHFVAMAGIFGVLLTATVLLRVFDGVPLGVFLGAAGAAAGR